MEKKLMPEGFDLTRWRQAERERLIELRKGLTRNEYAQNTRGLSNLLLSGFGALAEGCIGFCWPIANEPDPRFAIREWRASGARTALPVVMGPGQPLVFRRWWPGAPLEKGIYNIPYPVDTEELWPDAALVPANGIDRNGYRLGYGGGFFDRTLGFAEVKPISVALCYENAWIATIYPQPHDIPFDFVVTERRILRRTEAGLRAVCPEEANSWVRRLQDERLLVSSSTS
jgi:5,10-methenyltetrahydrofolate synthetase